MKTADIVPFAASFPPVMATQLQDPQMLTRLLYPNPVCLLSTYAPPRPPNIMTITWLTPINNNVCADPFRRAGSLCRAASSPV